MNKPAPPSAPDPAGRASGAPDAGERCTARAGHHSSRSELWARRFSGWPWRLGTDDLNTRAGSNAGTVAGLLAAASATWMLGRYLSRPRPGVRYTDRATDHRDQPPPTDARPPAVRRGR